jgi:hypothetical protein
MRGVWRDTSPCVRFAAATALCNKFELFQLLPVKNAVTSFAWASVILGLSVWSGRADTLFILFKHRNKGTDFFVSPVTLEGGKDREEIGFLFFRIVDLLTHLLHDFALCPIL